MDEKTRIYSLEDADLVRELASLEVALLPPTSFNGLNEKPSLSEWEKSFVAGVQTSWVRFGELTWKQRRSARELLRKVFDRKERWKDLATFRVREASRE